MKKSLAILLGKSISSLTKSLKIGGGSAAPGLYALKIHPELVKQLVSQIPTNIVITGTNGKTTTSRMLTHFAKEAGLKIIRNHTGSNLERGIASTLIQNFPKKFDLGVWELDEAAFNLVTPKIKPQIIVFLNVFRDQLDRYGEIDTVVKKWGETLKRLDKKTVVLINGDDDNCIKLKSSFKGKVYTFGVKDYKIVGESILHKREKQKLDFEAREVKLKGLSGTSFQLSIRNKLSTINLPLPGIYHIYDTVAAIATMSFLSDMPMHKYTSTLKSFQPAFGRVEKLVLSNSEGSHPCYIFLIKNPAGATQVFETIAPQLKKNDRLLLALNDNLADGTDVSWIWDAGFERLLSPSLRGRFVPSQ